jgi:hypothetical protein
MGFLLYHFFIYIPTTDGIYVAISGENTLDSPKSIILISVLF